MGCLFYLIQKLWIPNSYLHNDVTASYQERMMLAKLDTFVTEMGASLRREVEGTMEVISTIEYKHKSSIPTINAARNIAQKIGQLKNTICIIVGMNLDDGDSNLFRAYIPEIDYPFQVLHECLCSGTNICIYVIATTKIEYILIICFHLEVLNSYYKLLQQVKKRYL
jgi:hypothetical protein